MQYKLFLDDNDGLPVKEFEIEASSRPLVVVYKGTTYVHGPWNRFWKANVFNLDENSYVRFR